MLVLSRRTNETIVLPSIATRIQIVAIKAGVVRVGIDAPPSVPIYREELLERADFVEPNIVTHDEANAEARLHRLRQQFREGVARTLADLERLRSQIESGLIDPTPGNLDKIESELRRLEKLVAPGDA
jgi:carbon storage regulator CsrA